MEYEFLRKFSEELYADLAPVFYALLAVAAVMAILGEFANSYLGKGGGLSSILVRIVISIVLFLFFPQILEGAKEFMWALEMAVNKNHGGIEHVLDGMVSLVGKSIQGPMDFIKERVINVGSTIVFYIVHFIFFLYNLLWSLALIAAPFILPLYVWELGSFLFNKFISFIVLLLIVRLPWAILAVSLLKISDYLQHAQGIEAMKIFFIYVVGVVVTLLMPIVSLYLVATQMSGAASVLGGASGFALGALRAGVGGSATVSAFTNRSAYAMGGVKAAQNGQNFRPPSSSSFSSSRNSVVESEKKEIRIKNLEKIGRRK